MDNITHVKQGELSHFTIVCISYTCIYKCITRYGVTTNSFPNVASPMFASLFYFKWLYISVKWGKGGKKKDRKVTLPWYTFRRVRERQKWSFADANNFYPWDILSLWFFGQNVVCRGVLLFEQFEEKNLFDFDRMCQAYEYYIDKLLNNVKYKTERN